MAINNNYSVYKAGFLNQRLKLEGIPETAGTTLHSKATYCFFKAVDYLVYTLTFSLAYWLGFSLTDKYLLVVKTAPDFVNSAESGALYLNRKSFAKRTPFTIIRQIEEKDFTVSDAHFQCFERCRQIFDKYNKTPSGQLAVDLLKEISKLNPVFCDKIKNDVKDLDYIHYTEQKSLHAQETTKTKMENIRKIFNEVGELFNKLAPYTEDNKKIDTCVKLVKAIESGKIADEDFCLKKIPSALQAEGEIDSQDDEDLLPHSLSSSEMSNTITPIEELYG